MISGSKNPKNRVKLVFLISLYYFYLPSFAFEFPIKKYKNEILSQPGLTPNTNQVE
jgi:hypothetical protein